MVTILKSFQYSVFFHLALGALFVFSMPKNDKLEHLVSRDMISINLTGLSSGPVRGQTSNVIGQKISKIVSKSVKETSSVANKVQSDIHNEPEGDLANSGSVSNGASLVGGGTSDFNENIQSYFEPQYPKAALKRGLQGTMKIKISIGPEGTPIETQILQSSGHKILDDSALEAVRKWIFKKGNNSTYYVVKTIVFQIKN